MPGSPGGGRTRARGRHGVAYLLVTPHGCRLGPPEARQLDQASSPRTSGILVQLLSTRAELVTAGQPVTRQGFHAGGRVGPVSPDHGRCAMRVPVASRTAGRAVHPWVSKPEQVPAGSAGPGPVTSAGCTQGATRATSSSHRGWVDVAAPAAPTTTPPSSPLEPRSTSAQAKMGHPGPKDEDDRRFPAALPARIIAGEAIDAGESLWAACMSSGGGR